MNSRFHQKTPREMELEQKRGELAALRSRHAEARAGLQQLRDEIARFERDYDQTLGRRITELEELEAEISRFTGYTNRENRWDDGRSSGDGGDGFAQGSTSDYQEKAWNSAEKDIKSLYREVAKTIHPDLANSGSSTLQRTELMSKANRAYAEDDRRTLQEILRNWRSAPDLAKGDDTGAELARLTRQIAGESEAIRDVNAKLEKLRGSYVCRFKLRVDENLAMGSDLFAEMVAAADLNIARARRRLAALQGERTPKPPQQKQRRNICFPAGFSCGTLYLRNRTSLDFSQWKTLGRAMGCLEVEIDKAVRLDMKEQAGLKLCHLKQLKADDLQSLFLYEVSDTDLAGILHLTGLEELYLSGSRLTDAALNCISSLTNLKRIYLYQTEISDRGLVHLQRLPRLRGLTSSGNSITEEGLAGFQRAIPGVKTVSFQWKR